MAGHLNLWLSDGYLPRKLRRGQSVLRLKWEGVGDPAKYKPITMSDIMARCFHQILAQRLGGSLSFNTCKKAFPSGDSDAWDARSRSLGSTMAHLQMTLHCSQQPVIGYRPSLLTGIPALPVWLEHYPGPFGIKCFTLAEASSGYDF